MNTVDQALVDLLGQFARQAEVRIWMGDGRLLKVEVPRCAARVYLPSMPVEALGEVQFPAEPFRISAPWRGWLRVALRSEDPGTEFEIGVSPSWPVR